MEAQLVAPAPDANTLARMVQAYREAALQAQVTVLEAEWMDDDGIRLKPASADDLARQAKELGGGVLYLLPRPSPLDADDVEEILEAPGRAENAQGAIAVARSLADCMRTLGAPTVAIGYLRQGVFHHVDVEDTEAAALLSLLERLLPGGDGPDVDDLEELWEMDTDEAVGAILEEVDRMEVPDEVRREKPRIIAQEAARSLTGPEPLTGLPRERVHQAVLQAAAQLRRG